jgi:flagellum-specific peptidoglycan hydrolase FlgJ
MTREQFIKNYYNLAKTLTAGTGIFPEVMLAQAILESSGKVNGTWLVGQSLLSKAANNYFGIKASAGWTGSTISLKTGEVIDGKKVTVTGVFRKYPTIIDSFKDYIKFLQVNPRYKAAGVFSASTPSQQIAALAKAGYATDPNYASLLNSIINGFKKYIPAATIAFGLLIPAVIFFLIYKRKK